MAQDVQITVEDGGAGAVVVPSSSVQVCIGCCSSGTAAQVVATRSATVLSSTFGDGFLPEYGAMCLEAGGTVLAMRATTNTAGAIVVSAAETITGATNATPIVITTSNAHDYVDGAVVTVAAVGGNTAANGTFVITVLSSTTFRLDGSVGNGAYTSGGTATFTGTIMAGAGTSVVTLTGTPTDDFHLLLTVTTGGTIGTAGILLTLSLDAGRSTGPTIALGTASTLAIAGTGLTLNFAAGTLPTSCTVRGSTRGPQFNAAGIQACLDALEASPYALGGWGSIHIVTGLAGISASDAASIQGYIEGLTSSALYTGAMSSLRDAAVPAAWGGAGETETAWSTALLTDTSATEAKRVLVAAGAYNMRSLYPKALAGSPLYRRPLGWAQAARQVAIPPQRHSGRVRDGSLQQIIVSPSSDPSDGFIYHDERINPVFDILRNGTGRITAAVTWPGKQGFFIYDPLSLAAVGSDFALWPRRVVMDRACTIVHQTAVNVINSDVRLYANGTLYANEKTAIERTIKQQLRANMIDVGEITDALVVVDGTNDVRTSGLVLITVTIYGRGYVLRESITIGFASSTTTTE